MKLRWLFLLLILFSVIFTLEWKEIEKSEKQVYYKALSYQTELIYNQFRRQLKQSGLSNLYQSDFSRLNDQTECLIFLNENGKMIYFEGINANTYLSQWRNGKLTGLHTRYAIKNFSYHGELYQLLLIFKPLRLLEKPEFRTLFFKLLFFHLLGMLILLTILLLRFINPLLFLENFTKDGNFHKDLSSQEKIQMPFLSEEVRRIFLNIEKMWKKLILREEKIKTISDSHIKLKNDIQSFSTQKIHDLDQRNLTLKRLSNQLISELEMAKKVQIEMLPNPQLLESRRELKIGMRYTPMESLGGDLIDIIRVGRNGYAFLIADVSGHGIAAALITTMAKVSFNEHSGWNRSPDTICRQINTELCHLIGNLGYYLTAFYGVLNLENSTFTYVNAGHPSGLFYHKKTGKLSYLARTGTLLGVFEDVTYQKKTVYLHPGDRILLYTDGIVETTNKNMELYGVERLSEFFVQNATLDVDTLLNRLLEEIEEFSGHQPAQDDRAILIIEYVSDHSKPHIAKIHQH